jgi:hypothetical protein
MMRQRGAANGQKSDRDDELHEQLVFHSVTSQNLPSERKDEEEAFDPFSPPKRPNNTNPQPL